MQDDVSNLSRAITSEVAAGSGSTGDRVAQWQDNNRRALERSGQLFTELRAVTAPDAAMLSVALRELRCARVTLLHATTDRLNVIARTTPRGLLCPRARLCSYRRFRLPVGILLAVRLMAVVPSKSGSSMKEPYNGLSCQ